MFSPIINEPLHKTRVYGSSELKSPLAVINNRPDSVTGEALPTGIGQKDADGKGQIPECFVLLAPLFAPLSVRFSVLAHTK